MITHSYTLKQGRLQFLTEFHLLNKILKVQFNEIFKWKKNKKSYLPIVVTTHAESYGFILPGFHLFVSELSASTKYNKSE